MSACACLATKPGAIQRCFVTQEYTHFGRYRIRLYDGVRQQWQTVTVDDRCVGDESSHSEVAAYIPMSSH
jgi:hypothetical protein